MIKPNNIVCLAILLIIMFTYSVGANSEESVYMQYTAGNTPQNDTLTGNISLYEVNTITPVLPDENNGISYEGNNNDTGFMRTEKNGSPSLMTTLYKAVTEDNQTIIMNGSICFCTDTGKNNLNIEMEYFDEGEKDIIFAYINSEYDGVGLKTIKRTNSLEWKTASFSIEDAHFNNPDSVFEYDFRIDSNGIDTYIRKVTIANCDIEKYSIVTECMENLTIDVENTKAVEEDFILPSPDNPEIHIVWESDSDAVSVSDNTAVVRRKYIPTAVNLTAKITYKNAVRIKSFSLVISPVIYQAEALSFKAPVSEISDNKYILTVPFDLNRITFANTCRLLLAGIDKLSGKIYEIGTGASNFTDANNVSASVSYNPDYSYSHFLISDDFAVLKNNPPAKVAAVFTTQNHTLKAVWNTPADDYRAVSYYKIMVDGEEYATVSDLSQVNGNTENSFVFDGLEDGISHTISIIAYDHEGLKSEENPTQIKLDKMLEINLSAPPDGYGISFVTQDNPELSDAYTAISEKAGIVCRSTLSQQNGREKSYMYFSLNKNLIDINADKTIEITYFDEGTGNLMLQYFSSDTNSIKSTEVTALTNTQKWKTVSVNLTDAKAEASSLLSNCDFRLYGDTDKIFISKVRAIETSKY